MNQFKEISANEGIKMIKQISAREKVKTYLKNIGFSYIFPEDDIMINCVRDKVDVFVSNNAFELDVDLIKKCNLLQSEYFTKLEFIMEGSFRVYFEY